MSKIPSEFSPSVFHPFYLIRSGLKKALANYSHFMTGRMMDFGCGSKPYKSLFKVEEYVGVDFNNEGHSHANEQIDIIYDGKVIPKEDGYFDSVLASEVFEHVFNLDEVLKEINRVMKSGGFFLITCPFVWNEHEIPNDYARYTKFALYHLLMKNGYTIVAYAKSGNFLTAVMQMWVLYWNAVFHEKSRRLFLIRWLYKYLIVLPSNMVGVMLIRFLPSNDSLYLNNVVLAKKN